MKLHQNSWTTENSRRYKDGPNMNKKHEAQEQSSHRLLAASCSSVWAMDLESAQSARLAIPLSAVSQDSTAFKERLMISFRSVAPRVQTGGKRTNNPLLKQFWIAHFQIFQSRAFGYLWIMGLSWTFDDFGVFHTLSP